MSEGREITILVTGIVPAGASGMRDYGDLLGAELRRLSVDADVLWSVNEGGGARSTARATRAAFAIARGAPRGTSVVWNYAPVSCGYRGIPGPAVLLGLYLRARGVRVVAVLHELAEPWRGQPATTKVRSLAAIVALMPVLIGTRAWVVTTDTRARRLSRLSRWLRRPLRQVPVFSNLGEVPYERPGRRHGALAVGVLDYAATYARPDVVTAALRMLQDEGPVSVVLIGSPGPGTPAAGRWLAAAGAANLDGVSLTGILSTEDIGRRLAEIDLIVLPNEQGPASRKGTLAAALAHGRPVVSLDGPMRWDRPVDAGAVLVAPAEPRSLAELLRELRDDTPRREHLGVTGRRFYLDEMSLAHAGAELLELVAAVQPGGRR